MHPQAPTSLTPSRPPVRSRGAGWPGLLLVLLVLLVAGAAPAAAQTPYDYSVALGFGVGGFLDSTPDTGIDDSLVQALFAMRLEPHTYLGVRVGQVDLEVDEIDGGALFDTSLRYATVAGEYRFNDGWYESGLFLGVGAYDLDGDFAIADETAFGFTAGVTGDFRLVERLSLRLELAGHWADFDYSQAFVNGTVGLAFHF